MPKGHEIGSGQDCQQLSSLPTPPSKRGQQNVQLSQSGDRPFCCTCIADAPNVIEALRFTMLVVIVAKPDEGCYASELHWLWTESDAHACVCTTSGKPCPHARIDTSASTAHQHEDEEILLLKHTKQASHIATLQPAVNVHLQLGILLACYDEK